MLDTEGRELGPGQTWELEELLFLSGGDREELLAASPSALRENHPPLRFPAPPTGWCSWYCFGPRVTAAAGAATTWTSSPSSAPGLKYVQIDDGYQPAMGDWLETGPAFGGDVQGVLKKIRERGFEPAIWVAPFVAEEGSHGLPPAPRLVREGRGRPARCASDRVTFGGWRRGPWYALDGTHPEAQAHLEHVFRTMREEWGCTYFKLDANFWGAIHGGRFHDPQGHAHRGLPARHGGGAARGRATPSSSAATTRSGPSLGLIHGSRSSNDIKRTWARIAGTGPRRT